MRDRGTGSLGQFRQVGIGFGWAVEGRWFPASSQYVIERDVPVTGELPDDVRRLVPQHTGKPCGQAVRGCCHFVRGRTEEDMQPDLLEDIVLAIARQPVPAQPSA